MTLDRGRFGLFGLALVGGTIVACFSEHSPTEPSTAPPRGSVPSTAAVTVGDIFFKSALNASSNPAVDTVAVNESVTWTWAATGSLPHSVQSTGSPSFTSSGIQSGGAKTYRFQFTAPGTYQYDCAVHGTLMTGTIVVVASSNSSSTPPPSTPAPSTAATVATGDRSGDQPIRRRPGPYHGDPRPFMTAKVTVE